MSSRWGRCAAQGALVGLAALPLFFLLHAAIILPIWSRLDALLRGLVLAPAAGAVLGVALERVRHAPRFGGRAGGMLLGALAGLTLLPFAVAGWLRSRGAALPWWVLALALLLLALFLATLALQRLAAVATWRRAELFALLLLANAFPAFFLTFIGDFHDKPPQPFPFTLALGALYVASGAALSLVRERWRGREEGREEGRSA